jgi:hypothetical protein
MSLTLVSNTYPNQFTGNSIYARFNTTNYINTAGVKCSWIVGISTAPSYGDQFGFNSNLWSGFFAFLNGFPTIGASDHYLDVPSGTWDNANAQGVATQMNAYADFALYYVASAIGTDIKIEAKNTGDDYSMISKAVSGVTNGAYVAGVTEVLEQNYKIVVIVKRSYTNEILATLSINQIDGYAEVDLKEILHAQRKWTFVHDDSIVIIPLFDIWMPYRIYYTDSFGVPPYQQALQESSLTYVVPAKLDSNYFNLQKTPSPTIANWLTFTGVLKAVMTIAPRVNRRIDLTKNDYLLFLNNNNTNGFVKVQFTARYANNTSDFTIYNLTVPVEWHYYRVTVNFDKLAALPNQDDIIGFDVVLIDADTNDILSGVINYEVDRDNYPDKRNFVFQNKYWGVDTLLCTGAVTDNATFDKDIIASSGQYPLDKKFYTRINKVSQTKTFVQNTGWLTKDEVLVFEDMLRSEYVYVYDAALEDYKKIVISTDKVQLRESQRGMNAYEFEYSEDSSI